MHNDLLISQSYITLFPRLVKYIGNRIGDMESARDMAQDVFVKLLEARVVFLRKTALEAMAFCIAGRMAIDLMRRRSIDERMKEYYACATPIWTVDTESGILARDIESLEMRKMETLSQQKRIVYRMRRFEGLSNEEIALRLGLSKRTVENHTMAAFHEMRDFMRMSV